MTIEPDEQGGGPERRLPPAGNGSVAGHDELPAAIPSATFLAGGANPAAEAVEPRAEPAAPVTASEVSGPVAVVDAGPFDGLADLQAFQRRVAALAAVGALRLHRFADGRAVFEATLAEAGAPLQRQLRECLPDALVELTGAGLRVELGAGGGGGH